MIADLFVGARHAVPGASDGYIIKVTRHEFP